MAGELMIVVNRVEKNRKMPRDSSIRQEAARTDLKIREVYLDEVLKGKVRLTDPCITMCTSRDTYAVLEKMFPDVRKITFTETDDNFRRVSTVRHDTYVIASDIMEYLAAAGRKRVALFGFDRFSVYIHSTLSFFQNAAERFCVALSMNDIFLNESQLESCARNFIQQIHRYDAVVCVNDYAAVFLSTRLQSLGVRVPEDIFIIGQGNAAISRELVPSITTIDYMENDVGREAVSLYWYLLRHPCISRMDVLVRHKLLVRESTAMCPIRKLNVSLPTPKEVVLEDRGYSELMRLERLLMSDGVNRAILRMLETKTTAQMAEALYLSESTVKYRIGNIAKLLGVKNRKEISEILRTYRLTLFEPEK